MSLKAYSSLLWRDFSNGLHYSKATMRSFSLLNPLRTGCFFEVFHHWGRKKFIGSIERYFYVVSPCQRFLNDLFANWFESLSKGLSSLCVHFALLNFNGWFFLSAASYKTGLKLSSSEDRSKKSLLSQEPHVLKAIGSYVYPPSREG